MPRRLLIALLPTLGLLLAAGHLLYWYAPRERPAAPGDSLPARLFAAPDAAATLWAPYPHQLLGGIDGWRGAVAAAARRGGLEPPVIPRFGPFALPPAREIGAAATGDGGFAVAARVYPGVGLAARWGGRLAGNPWLAGGRIARRGGDLEVAWREGAWLMSRPGPALPTGTTPGERRPGLLHLRLADDRGVLPAGEYILERRGDCLAMADALRPPDLAAAVPPATGADLLRLEGGARPEALAVFADLPGLVPGLPAFAVLRRDGPAGDRLPGRGVLRLLGLEPLSAASGRWSVATTDPAALARGLEVAGELAAAEAAFGLPEWGAWVRTEPARRIAADLRRLLAGLQPLTDRQVRFVADVETLLDLAAPFSRVALTVSGTPPRALLLLSPGPLREAPDLC